MGILGIRIFIDPEREYPYPRWRCWLYRGHSWSKHWAAQVNPLGMAEIVDDVGRCHWCGKPKDVVQTVMLEMKRGNEFRSERNR